MAETSPAGRAPGRLSQWIGVLAAPAAFGVAALTNYVLAPSACQAGALQGGLLGTTVLAVLAFGVSVLMLGLGLWGAWLAYQSRAHMREANLAADSPERFFGAGGILVSVVFIALTLFVSFSSLAFQPCHPA